MRGQGAVKQVVFERKFVHVAEPSQCCRHGAGELVKGKVDDG